MPKLIDIIREDGGLRCMPTLRRTLDEDTSFDTDDNKNKNNDGPLTVPFEDPKIEYKTITVGDVLPAGNNPIFKYFLDGSRRTYHVMDVWLNNKTFPIIGAQIGVAVINKIKSGKYRPVKGFSKNYNLIAIPDKIEDADRDIISDAIKNKFKKFKFDIIKYNTKKEKDIKLLDLALAKIIGEMHKNEIKTIDEMISNDYLNENELMIVDGSLMFGHQKIEPARFKNVIGVSKTFNLSQSYGKGKKQNDIGTLVKRLNYGERTQVFKSDLNNHIIGIWYLRIRQKSKMNSQIQGIIKIEVFASDIIEQENGINGSRVEIISKALLRERNITCYGKDSRWAQHLYPIFLAESYIKSRYTNSKSFLGAF